MRAAVIREVVLPTVRVAHDVCSRTLFATVTYGPVVRGAVRGISQGLNESRAERRAMQGKLAVTQLAVAAGATSPSKHDRMARSTPAITDHVIAASLVATVACTAQCLAGPVVGPIIKVTGVLVITGLAVSAAVCAARRVHGQHLPARQTRALLRATSAQVRVRHGGLWAAHAFNSIYDPRARPELGNLGLAAAMQALVHGVGQAVVEGSVCGVLWNVAEAIELTVRSIMFVQDVEATAMALSFAFAAQLMAA